MNSPIIDSFLTLAEPAAHEIKIKGSRFIALGFPVTDETSAESRLEEIRKKEHAATHHCFAYVLGPENEYFRFSDDGEPAGTAGRPIHQAISGRHLYNVIVIVVRYYGGTKLGTGGLTRAYAQAAAEVLDGAKTAERLICDTLAFQLPFSLYDRVMRVISEGQFKIVAQDFSEEVKMQVSIRKSMTARFREQLIEITGGKIDITQTR